MGLIPFVSLFFRGKLVVFLSIKVILFFTFLLVKYKKDRINLFHNLTISVRDLISVVFNHYAPSQSVGSWRKEDPGCFPNPTDRNLRATSQPRFGHPPSIIRRCRKLRAWTLTSRVFEIWISSPGLDVTSSFLCFLDGVFFSVHMAWDDSTYRGRNGIGCFHVSP